MILLEPAALYLLAAAAAIAFLYLLRTPRQERRIPTAALWLRLNEVSRQVSRRRRTLISLALQLAIFLLMLFAAARPYRAEDGGGAGPGGVARHVAILLDASASMQVADAGIDSAAPGVSGGRTRFEAAQAAAGRILAGLQRRALSEENDRGLVVRVASEVQILQSFTDHADALRRAVDRAQATQEVADFTRAARLVGQLAGAYPGLEVFILSDGQMTGEARQAWRRVAGAGPAVAGSDAPETGKARVHYVPLGGPSSNLGIVTFGARRNLDAVSDFEVAIEVLNAGSQPARCSLELRMSSPKEEWDARLHGDAGDSAGVLIDAFPLEMTPGERQQRIVRKGNVPIEGILKAQLTGISGGNALALDDRAAQALPRTRRAKVVIFTDETGDFLEGVMRADIGIQAYRLPPADYQPNLPVDACIFVNAVPGSLPRCHLLLINTRGNLLLPSVSDARENELRMSLNEAISGPKVRTWSRHHPVLNRVSFHNLLVERALKLPVLAGSESIVRGEAGPLIAALERGRQKLLFVGFDPQDSDLVFRAAFPLLVDNAVRWFVEEETRRFSPCPRPGETFSLETESAADRIQVFPAPDRPQEFPVEKGRAVLHGLDQPGLYLYQDGKRLAAFGVNLASEVESATPAAEKLDVGEQPMGPAGLEGPQADRRLWPHLALLAGLLLVLESFLYHRRVAF